MNALELDGINTTQRVISFLRCFCCCRAVETFQIINIFLDAELAGDFY